jgi:pantoate kinase
VSSTYTTNFSTGICVGATSYNSCEIKFNNKTIDLDELHDVLETVKKRLLILTPNFEMHEKYPMLKEMYNEYLAMERLLGGPDSAELE